MEPHGVTEVGDPVPPVQVSPFEGILHRLLRLHEQKRDQQHRTEQEA